MIELAFAPWKRATHQRTMKDGKMLVHTNGKQDDKTTNRIQKQQCHCCAVLHRTQQTHRDSLFLVVVFFWVNIEIWSVNQSTHSQRHRSSILMVFVVSFVFNLLPCFHSRCALCQPMMLLHHSLIIVHNVSVFNAWKNGKHVTQSHRDRDNWQTQSSTHTQIHSNNSQTTTPKNHLQLRFSISVSSINCLSLQRYTWTTAFI